MMIVQRRTRARPLRTFSQMLICGALLAALASPALAKDKNVQPVAVSSAGVGPVNMRTVNQRWAGNRAIIRVAAEISKDRDKQGWSRSDWLPAPRLPGEREVKFRIWVSNREALANEGFLYRKNSIRPGTAFVAENWALSMPDKGKGLHLKLRFESAAVEARIEFDKHKLDELEDVERVMRVQIFQLGGPAAGAVSLTQDTPIEAPSGPSAPTLVQHPAPPTPAADLSSPNQEGPATFSPQIKMGLVGVQPADVQKGTEVQLVINYQVEGIPPGMPFKIVEDRSLRLGEVVIYQFDDTIARTAGTYSSSETVTVPADAPSGVYTFQAKVTLAGVSSEGSALFRVP